MKNPTWNKNNIFYNLTKRMVLFSVTSLLSLASYAQTTSPLVFFDFEKMNIISHGIYTPNADGTHSLNTIKAEVAARANGIDTITKYLNESCHNTNTDAPRLQPKFETMFHSQGTEIYADGALKVNLMASYKSIFHYRNATELKTSNGEVVVFALPSAIPADSLTCGTPALEFTNNINQNVRIQLIPAGSKTNLDSKEKLVKLVFDAQKKSLVVANAADSKFLQNMDLSFAKSGTTFLPVVIYSQK